MPFFFPKKRAQDSGSNKHESVQEPGQIADEQPLNQAAQNAPHLVHHGEIQHDPRAMAALSHRSGLASQLVTPPAAAGAAASQLLKRYRPLQTRAAGGFGSVEICLDSRLQRRVAIKRMPLSSPYSNMPHETTVTALAEARTASMLQHPNIVQVIDFSYDSAYAYLVMEYVDGMNLEEFLSQVEGHSLTYDEAACIADALVQALTFAHENGVLHLDIKPANVLIDRSGHVKLADFGMATLASAAGFGGARGGTIGYMSPEQLNGLEVDERSDVFSLAAVLYESLCASAPFRAATPADSLAQINKGVIYPSDLLVDISEDTEEALITALSPEADERMYSVADFGDLFCANLGNAREGRKSLSRMIAKLTSDEETDDELGAEATHVQRVWELDPAEGYLGSRFPQARKYVQAACAGITSAIGAFSLLSSFQSVTSLTAFLAALVIGVAAAMAPQLAPALLVAGWLTLIAGSTPLVSVLPVLIVMGASAAGWWLVWGRSKPESALTFCASVACALLAGNSNDASPLILAAPITAVVAGLTLSPSAAAPSTGVSLTFAWFIWHSIIAASTVSGGTTGTFDLTMALGALFTPYFLLSLFAYASLSALLSFLFDKAWSSYLNHRGTSGIVAANVLVPVVSFVVTYLAQIMEFEASSTSTIAAATVVGVISSILIWLYMYLLGYKRTDTEVDS